MGRLLDRIRQESPAHTVDKADEGFVIARRDGQDVLFDELVRQVLNGAGADYVAFPINDRQNSASYDRMLVIPLD